MSERLGAGLAASTRRRANTWRDELRGQCGGCHPVGAGPSFPSAISRACDSSPKVKADNAKPSEVAQKVRDAVGDKTFVRPGKWLSTVTIQEMTIPGVPPVRHRAVQHCLVITATEHCIGR